MVQEEHNIIAVQKLDSHWASTVNKYKKQLNELKDEAGMAGSKSIQTRFVGTTTSTIHPYACLSCTY